MRVIKLTGPTKRFKIEQKHLPSAPQKPFPLYKERTPDLVRQDIFQKVKNVKTELNEFSIGTYVKLQAVCRSR